MLRTGVIWKSGCWWWVTNRFGWLLELLTELINWDTSVLRNARAGHIILSWFIIIFIAILGEWNRTAWKYLKSSYLLAFSFLLVLDSTDILKVCPGFKEKLVPVLANCSTIFVKLPPPLPLRTQNVKKVLIKDQVLKIRTLLETVESNIKIVHQLTNG